MQESIKHIQNYNFHSHFPSPSVTTDVHAEGKRGRENAAIHKYGNNMAQGRAFKIVSQ